MGNRFTNASVKNARRGHAIKLTHGRAHGVEHFRLGLGQRAFDERAGRRFVPAAAELLGDLAAIHLAAAAEAHFRVAAGLLDHDDRHLRAAHVEREVDDVFGVGRKWRLWL